MIQHKVNLLWTGGDHEGLVPLKGSSIFLFDADNDETQITILTTKEL